MDQNKIVKVEAWTYNGQTFLKHSEALETKKKTEHAQKLMVLKESIRGLAGSRSISGIYINVENDDSARGDMKALMEMGQLAKQLLDHIGVDPKDIKNDGSCVYPPPASSKWATSFEDGTRNIQLRGGPPGEAEEEGHRP